LWDTPSDTVRCKARGFRTIVRVVSAPDKSEHHGVSAHRVTNAVA
jgi:hypothetical protein